MLNNQSTLLTKSIYRKKNRFAQNLKIDTHKTDFTFIS